MSFAHPRLWQLALATFMKIARPGDERPKVKEKSVDIHVRGFSDFNCQHGNRFYIYIYIYLYISKMYTKYSHFSISTYRC